MDPLSHARTTEAVTVLIADDDPIFRDLVCGRLHELDAAIIEASDGAAAWTLLLSRSFDLAIVDLGMPELNGFDLIRCIRGHPRTKHLPIIVMTSRNDAPAVEEALRVGATAFLTKPVNWGTFGCYIGFLLRLAAADRQARASDQLAKTVARAKDALLANFCEELALTTRDMRNRLEAQLAPMADGHAYLPDMASTDDQLRDLVRLEALGHTAKRLAKLLAEDIVVADRKEDLPAIAAGALAQVGELLAARQLHVETAWPAQRVAISCHAESIGLALQQLLKNAAQHSPPSGTIRITGELHDDGMLTVDVTDGGAGMHPEYVALALSSRHIMQRRADDQPQAGFGLPLARAIAEAHGGALEVRSMVGEGTSAMLVLPADRVFVSDYSDTTMPRP